MNTSTNTFTVGQQLIVPTDPVLGNDPFPVTVTDIYHNCIRVKCEDGWLGFLSFDLSPLQTFG